MPRVIFRMDKKKERKFGPYEAGFVIGTVFILLGVFVLPYAIRFAGIAVALYLVFMLFGWTFDIMYVVGIFVLAFAIRLIVKFINS